MSNPSVVSLGTIAREWTRIGLAFIVPAVVMVTALSALFLAENPPAVIRGAGAEAGAAVAAVAVQAGLLLLGPSYARAREPDRRWRWCLYVGLGGLAAALIGRFLVLVLLACGAAEAYLRARPEASMPSRSGR